MPKIKHIDLSLELSGKTALAGTGSKEADMRETIEIEIDFYVHLLKCLYEQKYLYLQPTDIIIERQAIIDQAHRDGTDLLVAFQGNKESEKALERCQERITKDLILIGQVIRNKSNDPKVLTELVFKWGLVRQECEMYCLIGDEIENEEFEELCLCRGFDKDMKEYIRGTMKYAGLGGNL
jgi:hypothetical protein